MKFKREDEKWYKSKYCLEKVSRNGKNLKYVKNKTEEICLTAISQDKIAIEFVNKEKFPKVYEYYILLYS